LILAVVDHRKRFIDLTVGWPGSVADGGVWANSVLKANIENFLSPLPAIPIATVNDAGETINELVPAFLLGDSAYPNNARIITTFKNTDYARCSITKHLNQKLAGARYYVENAFGICKDRFRILSRPLKYTTEDITRAITLVTAVCILHNFLIDIRDEMDIIPDPRSEKEIFITREDGDVIDQQGVDMIDVMTRDILLRHIRWIDEDED
jgi:DDE superfamily endonuclease